MHFIPKLAPYKAAILPLIKKRHNEKANELYEMLTNYFDIDYDASGSIGKRYRTQDAMGTPYCITIDDNTIDNNTVTIRNRDTMEQITLSIDEIKDYLLEKIQ